MVALFPRCLAFRSRQDRPVVLTASTQVKTLEAQTAFQPPLLPKATSATMNKDMYAHSDPVPLRTHKKSSSGCRTCKERKVKVVRIA